MKGFKFEKDLPHQKHAVESVIDVFENLPIEQPNNLEKNFINPEIIWKSKEKDKKENNEKEIKPEDIYLLNIENIQNRNEIKNTSKLSNIIDIMMETGTGKTYTYTKTIFELNKKYDIFKFVIIVPTLSIKAGTISFLKSESCREHFKEQYGKNIQLHIVESQKNNKNKKTNYPASVSNFINSTTFDKQSIHVMIINAGMINSETMQKQYDITLMDKYSSPFDAIASVKPFVIIDEPHKFAQSNKTWENIQKLKPQFILRYGATFKEYENLIYKLTAVEAFNKNLVKGVIAHITEFESGKNAVVKLIATDGKEAKFELIENNKHQTFTVARKESLSKIHSQMEGLEIESLNKSTVVLSNGLELKRGDKINPYSYAQKLQEIMIQKAIQQHFEIEKELLKRDVKIKPLTLFFIDNIEEYRSENGYIRKIVEQYIQSEVLNLLKNENNPFYKSYLENTLNSLSFTHGGYFSQDNTDKDEEIEKEINEILHDKEALLDLNNPRRFIFSKWTLREGWDNPNVFIICKLRSSGSEISKLQEVGRGLRLPVNEFGNRVKDEQFYLHYFVDFTETDFVDELVKEINEKSEAISIEQVPEKLSEEMIKKICEVYQKTEEELLVELDKENVITRTNAFKASGFEYIKQHYPLIFEGVDTNKIRKVTDSKRRITIRTERYHELKELWEKLNEKVILEYKFNNEAQFKYLLTQFLKTHPDIFTQEDIKEKKSQVDVNNNEAVAKETTSVYNRRIANITTLRYSQFLKEIARLTNINIKTIHQSIIESGININQCLNQTTIRKIKQEFENFLLEQVFDKYSIEYKKISNRIHPTKLTNENGEVLQEISPFDVGVMFSDEVPPNNYLFNELFYDSELEKNNIKEEIDEVVIFTKIPKNSIKIPIVGGRSYTPDFAYVIKKKNNSQTLYLIVETKNVPNDNQLSKEELMKIKHAEKIFNCKIVFKKQLSNKKISEIINEILI